MKDFDTDVKKYADKVRLKAAERRELRERILAYMEYHPLPKQKEKVVVSHESIISERFVTIPFNALYARIAAGVFGFVLIVGVPFAAERAVPGDVLYPFKTHINEGIRVQFANSPYEKIALETSLMERRIAEARLLASEGKLTEEVEAAIAEDVKNHVSAAQQGLAELRAENEEDAVIAEIAFGSVLEVQSAVLEGEAKGATSSETGIRSAIKVAKEEAAQKKSTTTPSYEGLLARVEAETTRAYELFLSVDSVLSEVERADVERRLADIDRKIEGAGAKYESNIDEAKTDLISALGLTQKLIAFVTDIDVRESVPLETLVPVELTLEERRGVTIDLVRTVVTTRTAIASRLLLEEGDIETAVSDKVLLGLEEVARLTQKATSSLAIGNIDDAEQAAKDAAVLVTDLDALLPATSEESVPPEVDPVETPEEIATTTETGTEEEEATTTPPALEDSEEIPAEVATTTKATTTEEAP